MLYKYNTKTLLFEKVKIKHYVYTLLLSIFIFSGMGFTGALKVNSIVEKIPVIVKTQEEEFSKEWLLNKLTELNVAHPNIVYAQSIIETDHFRSNIFKVNKNLFGMKCAQSRITTHKGEQFNHAKYNSYYESIIDLCLWQEAYARNLTDDEYYQLLHEVYAEDKTYVDRIKQLIKQGLN